MITAAVGPKTSKSHNGGDDVTERKCPFGPLSGGSALQPRSTNPRTHSKKQVGQIASPIRRFGFTNPVLVDDANGIVAGHGRVEAAKAVGLDQVPTVRLSAMSEAEIRAYVIADNRLAENAGWDRALLGLELSYLPEPET